MIPIMLAQIGRSATGNKAVAGDDSVMHVNYVSPLVFIVILVAGIALSIPWLRQGLVPLGVATIVVSVLVAWFVASAIRIIPQWEKALVLRLGKFVGLRGPGFFLIIPILEVIRRVDTRILTYDIPSQQVITKDNVPVSINGVLYFKVVEVGDAVMKVQDYVYAIAQYAQTALRDVIGGMTLDELLSEREKIGKMIEETVEKESRNWGLEVISIRLQDIEMPEELKKMMARQASAEREKRATITKAEGDKLAAVNLAEAARLMRESAGAMQLRTLQTIDGLGPSPSNTVVLAVPVDVMEAVKAFTAAQSKS